MNLFEHWCRPTSLDVCVSGLRQMAALLEETFDTGRSVPKGRSNLPKGETICCPFNAISLSASCLERRGYHASFAAAHRLSFAYDV
ncbi:hypothetical protein [Bradyrhizobium macuxiense]|uniref:hypothetical protein n=1 Tax=Bradyrhizobium macuxiense TaxID=1755647 RepID=UPI0010A967E8|nr:hypothetical protein [Bradyrhizobium macuxiense]